uniref:Extracellular solute-binding protein n=1 Tax=Ignisphaera aggregans TaxID=334771 RepID=A0A7C2VHL9_9CREN
MNQNLITVLAVVLTAIIVGAAVYVLAPAKTVTETATVTKTVTTTVTQTQTSTVTPLPVACPVLPEPSEPITLKFWKWQSLTIVDNQIQRVIDMWNQLHPNVKIEFTVMGELSTVEFTMKVEQMTDAGQGPDIVMIDELSLADLAYDGYLAELPDYLQEIVKKNIVEPFDQITYFWGPDGVKRMYGFPGLRGASVKVLIVNDYMLQEIGYPTNWCPKDWNELIDVAKRLTKYDDQGNLVRSGLFVRVSGHIGGIFDKFGPIFLAAGGRILWCENGQWKTDVNSNIGRTVLQLYYDVLYTHHIYDPGFPGDTAAFAQELVAMLLPREPTEVLNALLALNPERFRDPQTGQFKGFHFCPIPPPSQNMSSRTWLDMHVVGVNAYSPPERQQWAFAFLCWVAINKDVKLTLFNEIGMWAPWRDIVNEPPFDQLIFQQILEIAKTGESRVIHPRSGSLFATGGEVLSRIYLKELSIEDGLRELEKALLEAANEVPCVS